MPNNIIPQKLKKGDEIRVIAPSFNISRMSKEIIDLATAKLESFGFSVSISKHAAENDVFGSSSIESRVSDLDSAFIDKNVKCILTAIGGYNCGEILKLINYQYIKDNPKIFLGYSDITALLDGIYAKTGMVTYHGPFFSTFGMVKGLDYTLDYFKKCVMESKSYVIEASTEWSDDKWYADQQNRKFTKNIGPFVINEGSAKGKILGGNLCTMNLLQGTEFMPNLRNSVLFLEDDKGTNTNLFSRNLEGLIHLPKFEMVKAIVVGRFQESSGITTDILKKIIATKKDLKQIPVIGGIDFGHTNPITTFPIGGNVSIEVGSDSVKIKVLKH
jgi:muramoyltetrapeptide carboxypeptidase